MWKKLVSLNLALLLLLAPMTAHAAADTKVENQKYATFYLNDGTNPPPQEIGCYYTKTTDGNLYVYPYRYTYEAIYFDSQTELTSWIALPQVDNGRVVTSYNTKDDGRGTSYALTSIPENIFSPTKSNPLPLYAQWENVSDRFTLYIGQGVGPTTDNKDYVLKSNLTDKTTLELETIFIPPENNQIIGWESLNSPIKYYFPGEEVSLDTYLILIPTLGVNYIRYHYYDTKTDTADRKIKQMQYKSNELIGQYDGSLYRSLYIGVTDSNKYFVGWNDSQNGTGQWQSRYVKGASHDLYAQYADWPNDSEKYCILYSWLGLEGEESGKMCKLLPLTDGKVTELPSLTSRAGYTFKGWYKEKQGTNPVQANQGNISDKAILYAKWEKNGGTSTDQTWTITYPTGNSWGTLITDSDGKITRLPPTPSKDGYTFVGWFDGETDGNPIKVGDKLTGNITIYPHWTPTGGTNPGEDGNKPDEDGNKPGEDDNKPEEDGNKPGASKTYTVTFNANGGSGGTSLTTGTDGKLASLPGAPTRSGYTFDGWYTSASGGDRITSSTVFTQNITVYAHWSQTSNPVTPSDPRYRIYTPDRVTGGSLDVSHGSAREGTRITLDLSPRSNYELDWLTVTNLDTGRRVRLTERRSDSYTFTMPSSDVEVELAYYRTSSSSSTYSYYVPTQPQARSGPTAWYYKDRHIYHFTNGLVPDSTYLTRDMLISVLYNLTDHSLDSATTIGSETTDSMLWASGNNILPNVYVSGLWGVDKPLSREQAAMLIFHYAKYRGRNTSQTTDLTRYADSSRVRPIAQNALSWTAAAGLIPGASASKLSPQDHLTCGETGDILYRFLSFP